MKMIKSCLIGFLTGLSLALLSVVSSATEPSAPPAAPRSVESLAAALSSTTEGNVYYCYRDVNHYDRTVCVKIGTTSEPVPGELQAAQEAALFQVPVRSRLTWWDGGGMTEYCRGSVHGDCSGACRITAVLPNGDVTVECGERTTGTQSSDPQTESIEGGVTTLGDPICVPDRPCCLPSDGANCPKRRLP